MNQKPLSDKGKGHDRVSRSLLLERELRLYHWCAARSPSWLTPDLCTAIGFAGAVLAAVSYVLSGIDRHFLWLAALGWLINGYGDAMDGAIARYRKIERPTYGFYIDHSVDAVSVVIIGLGFAFSPYVSIPVGLLVVIGYLILNMQLYIYTCATRVHHLSYGRLGPTEFRLFAIVFSLVLYGVGRPQIRIHTYEFMLWDPILLAMAFSMLLLVLISVFQNARALAAREKRGSQPNDMEKGADESNTKELP